MPSFVTCGPNEAIIVSGCCQSSPTIRAGGRVFVWPLFHRVQRLSLNTMTLNIESPKVYSLDGVPVTVKGVAQVKIQGKDLVSLRAASEMFLDKTEDEIMDIAKATIDGHQRSVIAKTSISDMYQDRKKYSQTVHQDAQSDLIDMGLTLISFTIQNISDDEGYLRSLGEIQTVPIKAETRKEIAACKAVTEAENLATEQSKRMDDLRAQNEIQLQRLEFEERLAEYLKNEFKNKAISEKAGDLKAAGLNLEIIKQELEVLRSEKSTEVEMIKKKKELKGLELIDQINLMADFKCERDKKLSEAFKKKAKAQAEAEADRIKRLATARAAIIQKEKEAEAEVLLEKAKAFKEFGNAAKLEMVLAMLPRLTAEIAGPITDCKKITSVSQDGSVGFSRITNEILEVVGQICNSVGNISAQYTTDGNGNDDDNSSTFTSAPGPSTPQVSLILDFNLHKV